ncbi:PadR family transcriptional regulator [Nocardioides taihuensis]|uniref:PadR family transcriptional regulator n=1 Tax=Nocardioides taihuensis TaxID=1835606 RepID=A0ABW0BEI7_9ACTN
MTLTTTSYAILGLLDLRDWSAYELAQQATRSLAYTWPVSESQLYAEPKRLAREGLISVHERAAGPVRSRQVFSITAAGRRALRAWLATEPAAPVVRIEALLRCLLATSGGKDDLLRSLAATREAAAQAYDNGQAMVGAMVTGELPFPERLHANVLWMTFAADLLRLVVEWADSAAAEVEAWDDAEHGGDPARARRMLESLPRLLPGD